MISRTSLYEVETVASSYECSPGATWSDTRLSLSGIGGRRPVSRPDLLFAPKSLGGLRDGLTHPRRMLGMLWIC
jgi:hypothetical protein